MATVNFYLRDQASDKETPVVLFFSVEGKRVKLPTGEKIHPRFWNDRKQEVKASYTGSIEINHSLNTLGKKVIDLYREMKANDQAFSGQVLKARLQDREVELVPVEKATKRPVLDFWAVLDQFIEDSQATRRDATLKTYRTLYRHLKEFVKTIRYGLTFESINSSFRDKFQNYLIRHRQMSDTSIQKNFQILKRFLNYATDHGYNQNMEYNRFKFRRKPVVKVALTENELLDLIAVDLSAKPRLDRVRDLFVFGCETSLRYSDIISLRGTHIKTTEVEGESLTYLDLVAQKTRGEIQAPLSSRAIDLIQKYRDPNRETCFPVISNQKYNDYLKEAAELAGIDTLVELVRFVGTERIEERIPKWKLIGSHTARRTFVTLFFERGGSVPACMVYTGHKDYKELETYRKKTLLHRLKIAKDSYRPQMRKVL